MKLQRLHLKIASSQLKIMKVTVVRENFERAKVDVEGEVECV